ncbi:MAG: hypothetical protein ACFCU3_05040 [Verrucomicrobiales bacterium]
MTSYEVELLLGAEIEFLELYSVYGDRFYVLFDECLDQIRKFPRSAPIYTSPFHRLLIRKTPYALFYAVEGRRVLIHAILDLRMSPSRIAERLGGWEKLS